MQHPLASAQPIREDEENMILSRRHCHPRRRLLRGRQQFAESRRRLILRSSAYNGAFGFCSCARLRGTAKWRSTHRALHLADIDGSRRRSTRTAGLAVLEQLCLLVAVTICAAGLNLMTDEQPYFLATSVGDVYRNGGCAAGFTILLSCRREDLLRQGVWPISRQGNDRRSGKCKSQSVDMDQIPRRTAQALNARYASAITCLLNRLQPRPERLR